MLVRDMRGLVKECSSLKNKEGYIFITKEEKVGRGEDQLLIFGWTSRLTTLVPPLTLHWFNRDVMALLQSYILAKGWLTFTKIR